MNANIKGNWQPMDTAPRDGTMLRLLVQFEEHATEDTTEPAPTIGAYEEGAERWQFAGWCWSHDHFTEGKGKPVGWLPMLVEPDAADSGRVTALSVDRACLTYDNATSDVADYPSEVGMRAALEDFVSQCAALAAQGQGEAVGDADADTLDAIASEIGAEFKHGARAHGLRMIAKRIRSRPAPPASPAGVPDGWVSDPDTIPKPIINACRDAICREFGNNGTDGYYKRILAKVFAALAAQGQGEAVAGAPSIEAAEAMGAKGGPVVEAERLAFEAWMRGHCWALCATWSGTGYRSDAEQGGKLCPHAMETRRLWAAWRDRAALTAPAASPAEVPDGWVLVPVKSTDAMHQAYIRAKYDGPKPVRIPNLWVAMLAAAPSPGESE